MLDPPHKNGNLNCTNPGAPLPNKGPVFIKGWKRKARAVGENHRGNFSCPISSGKRLQGVSDVAVVNWNMSKKGRRTVGVDSHLFSGMVAADVQPRQSP